MKVLRLLLFVLAVAATSVPLTLAQSDAPKSKSGRKSHILKGKVTELSPTQKTITVDHQKVEGYMDAMTMPYKVANMDAFKTVKVGDQIEATVYDADYTLYDIKVVPKTVK